MKPSQKQKKGKGKAKVQMEVEEEHPASDAEEEEVADGESFPTFAGLAEEDLNDEDEDVEDEDDIFDGELRLARCDFALRPCSDCVESSLPAWKSVQLHGTLKRAILALNFLKPTDIQAKALPSALNGRDIVGVAETVSQHWEHIRL